MKSYFSVFLIMAGLGFSSMQAQILVIRFQDGTEQSESLGSIKTITFPSNELTLNFVTGMEQSFGLFRVNKLSFQNVTSDVNNLKPNCITTLVYDRTTSSLRVNNASGPCTLASICNVNGSRVQATIVPTGDSHIDVSGLKSGFYLVKIYNQVYKFVKP